MNGVFLLALCFTILIDSIERFVSPEEIKQPLMVLITGSAGLVANLVGLFLFHDHGGHGHSHGHNHGHTHQENDVELQAHNHTHGGHLNMRGVKYTTTLTMIYY